MYPIRGPPLNKKNLSKNEKNKLLDKTIEEVQKKRNRNQMEHRRRSRENRNKVYLCDYSRYMKIFFF